MSFEKTREEAEDMAHARVGLNAKWREKNDPLVVQAKKDLARFLDTLPPDIPEPSVHAGSTLPDDKTILWICWHDEVNTFQNQINISFHGDGSVMVQAWGENGEELPLHEVTITDMVRADIVEWIRYVTRCA